MNRRIIAGLVVLLGVAANGKAATLYWWPGNAGAGLGGNGTWNTSVANWSTSDTGKVASATVPGSGDTAVFGGTAGALNYISGQSVGNFRVMTSGYVFTLGAGTTTLTVGEFSGAGLADTTIRAQGASMSSTTLSLTVTGTTSYTGTLSDGALGAPLVLRKLGNGLLDLSSATLSQTGATYVSGGILRVKEGTGTAGSLPTSQTLQLGTGGESGILEVIGNGVSSSFTRKITTSTATANGVWLGTTASSVVGFGALQGDLTINLDNDGSNKSWGATGFGAGTIILGTKASTGKVTLVNPLTLIANGPSVAKIQVVHGENSTQKVDAELQGALQISGTDSGGGAIANRVLEKSGDGTLVLSGTSNAFNGRLHVSAGALLITGRFISNTSNANALTVDAGATLGGSGTVAFTNASARIKVDGTLQAGLGAANTDFDAGYSFKTLTLSQSYVVMGADSVLAFGLGSTSELHDTIATINGGIWEFGSEQKIKFYNAGLTTVGITYTIMTGLSANPLPASWQVYDSDGINGSFSFADGAISFTVSQIPEPHVVTLAIVAGAALLVLPRSRRRSC